MSEAEVRTGLGRWWQTVGGRYAVSFPGWLITTVVGVSATVVTVPGATGAEILAWAGLAFIAQLVLGVVTLLAWLSYLRPSERPSRPIAALATYVVVGVGRALIMGIGATEAGLQPDPNLEWRIPASVVTMVTTSVVAAVVVTWAREFSVTLAQLRREQQRQDVLHEQAQGLVDSYRADLLAEVERRVHSELEELAATDTTLKDHAPHTSDQLRRIVDEVVRPISHEFARRRVDEDLLLERVHEIPLDVRPSTRAITDAAFTASPFTPRLTSVILFALLFTGMMRVTDQLTALLAAAVCISVITIGLWLAERIVTPHLPRMPLALRVVTVIAVWFAIGGAQWLLERSSPRLTEIMNGIVGGLPEGLATVGIDAFVMLLVAIATGLNNVMRQVTDARVEAVEATTRATARLRQVAWAEQRELGRLIHSDVQARIISTAIRISIDPEADVPALLRDLDTDLRSFFDNPTASEWRNALTSMTAVWRLSTDFSIEIPDDVAETLDSDWPAAAAVIEFISEATTNTIRHGDATTVHARIEHGIGSLRAVVDSDGYIEESIVGAEQTADGGLGTRTLSELTLNWQFMPGGSGTLASAEIPLAHSPDIDDPAGSRWGYLDAPMTAEGNLPTLATS